MSTPPKPPAEVYEGLRSQILNLNRKSHASLAAIPEEVWGTVMDWGMPNGTATVVALGDGTASIYLSSGGGHIGGGGVPVIRNAAIAAVKIANELRGIMQPATAFPLPQTGGVVFYALTDAGRFTTRGTQAEMQSRTNAAWKLGAMMQQVISEYRKLDTQRGKPGSGSQQ